MGQNKECRNSFCCGGLVGVTNPTPFFLIILQDLKVPKKGVWLGEPEILGFMSLFFKRVIILKMEGGILQNVLDYAEACFPQTNVLILESENNPNNNLYLKYTGGESAQTGHYQALQYQKPSSLDFSSSYASILKKTTCFSMVVI